MSGHGYGYEGKVQKPVVVTQDLYLLFVWVDEDATKRTRAGHMLIIHNTFCLQQLLDTKNPMLLIGTLRKVAGARSASSA